MRLRKKLEVLTIILLTGGISGCAVIGASAGGAIGYNTGEKYMKKVENKGANVRVNGRCDIYLSNNEFLSGHCSDHSYSTKIGLVKKDETILFNNTREISPSEIDSIKTLSRKNGVSRALWCGLIGFVVGITIDIIIVENSFSGGMGGGGDFGGGGL